MSDTPTTARVSPAFGAEATVREIGQQPEVWAEASANVEARRSELDGFLSSLLDQENLRIVLTGAGTSAFIGGIAAPALSRILGRRVDAVATTDIVSNPFEYFAEDLPTLLVSFARSGNSPESVAATRLADVRLGDVHHLVLTCNPAGDLYREHADRKGSLVLVMPTRANDAGFAMTSSFTSMLLSILLVLGGENTQAVEALSAAAHTIIQTRQDSVREVASADYERVVYLGSGPLTALARESALKLLELTAGKVVSYYDSALGFRHGPKAVLDERTLVVVFVSSDPHTRRYDLDIIQELRVALGPERVLAIAGEGDASIAGALTVGQPARLDDAFLAVAYVVFAQIVALSFALRVGTTPDNPFPNGDVNRVVQGVEIYPLPSDDGEEAHD
jgi:tagatose-6-phosphate ketose/aldose isomerase